MVRNSSPPARSVVVITTSCRAPIWCAQATKIRDVDSSDTLRPTCLRRLSPTFTTSLVHSAWVAHQKMPPHFAMHPRPQRQMAAGQDQASAGVGCQPRQRHARGLDGGARNPGADQVRSHPVFGVRCFLMLSFFVFCAHRIFPAASTCFSWWRSFLSCDAISMPI